MVLSHGIILCLLFQLNTAHIIIKKDPPPEIKLEVLCTLNDDDYRVKCVRFDSPLANLQFKRYVDIRINNNFMFKEIDEATTLYSAGFSCTAPYPVEWSHSQGHLVNLFTTDWYFLLHQQKHTYKRNLLESFKDYGKSDVFNNPNAFSHSAMLDLRNAFSLESAFSYAAGEYVCKSVETPSLSAKMSIYQESSVYEKLFALSEKTVTVYENEATDGTITFPCHVLNPEIANVTLYKQIVKTHIFGNNPSKRLHYDHLHLDDRTNSTLLNHTVGNTTIIKWEPLQLCQYLSFKPDVGFIYVRHSDMESEGDSASPSFQLSPGIYKCVAATDNDNENHDENEETANDEADFVMIDLKSGSKPDTLEEQYVTHPAFLNYTVVDPKRNFINVKCCSTTDNPPDIYLGACSSKIMCEKQKLYLSSTDLGKRGANSITIVDGKCRKTFDFSFGYTASFNIKCVGDGINAVKTFIQEFDSPEVFTHWEDIDPAKMISIHGGRFRKHVTRRSKFEWTQFIPAKNDTPFIVYDGQNVSVQCKIATAFLAIGSHFVVHFVNGTESLIKEDKLTPIKDDIWHFGNSDITFKVTSDMKAISCHAPIIHSKKWVDKSLDFEVKDSEEPIIMGDPEIEVYWTLGEKNKKLSCEFSGSPTPKVGWLKDSRKIVRKGIRSNRLYNHTIDSESNTTSILEVEVATYETHGEYTCIAKNYFGSANKTFKVYVRASERNWTIVCVSLGLICFTIIIAFVGYKTWRLRQVLKANGVREAGPEGFTRMT